MKLSPVIFSLAFCPIFLIHFSFGERPLSNAMAAAGYFVRIEAGGQSVDPPKRQPIRIGGNVLASRLIHPVEAVYPQEARRKLVSGSVVLQATVNEKGQVWEVRVISGHALLRDAAVDAVRQWRYEPLRLGGEPVPMMGTVVVPFSLEREKRDYREFVGLKLRVDRAGVLWEGNKQLKGKSLIDSARASGQLVWLTPEPEVPPAILRETLERFRVAGIQAIIVEEEAGELLGIDAVEKAARKLGFKLHGYTIEPASGPGGVRVWDAQYPNEWDTYLEYELAVNQSGEVTSIRQLEGGENPEIAAALSKMKIKLRDSSLPNTIYVKLWLKKLSFKI